MSAIAGIRGFGGRPADPASLARLAAALSHRGPDGEGHWVEGPVGLGHRLLHATPESLWEKHSVCDERGECRLVWDGRLDNRHELIAALGSGETSGHRDRTDPELVLEAYLRWGEPSFARLAGDFALAIWDGRNRRLVCVRDPLGAKPLYYHADAERFLFCSEAAPMLADPAVGTRPDEAMIADFLLMDFRDPGATFFQGIGQLPPGHLLSVDDAGLALRRYCELGGSRETRYARDGEYAERFLELFREAVRCRLRSHAPLGVLLSGGIDSTSVAAMAEALRRDDPGLPALLAATVLCDGFLREEWEAIQALRGAYGTDVRTTAPDVGRRRGTDFETFLARSETIHHEAFMTVPLATGPMIANGCRAVLTGFGSDELIGSGETGFVKDLLRGLRLFRFARESRRLAAAYGADGPGSAASLAWSALPPRLRRLCKRAAGRDAPRWIEPAFARRIGDRRRDAPPARRFPTLCQEASYRAITHPSLALALTWMDAAASASGLECRHPFLDRRLIEFFLSIPPEAKVSVGYRKMFLQHALRSIVPSPPRPVETTEMLAEPMAHETWTPIDAERLSEILFHPRALVFEYVDRREAERIRDRYLAGEERCRNLLWQFTKLELWLQEFMFERQRHPGGRFGSGAEPPSEEESVHIRERRGVP